eukprot:gene8684-9567_t
MEDSSTPRKESFGLLLEFTDPVCQHKFVQFRANQLGRSFFTYASALLVSMVFVLYWFIIFRNNHHWISVFACALTFLFSTPLLWAIAYVKQSGLFHLDVHPRLFFLLENAFLLALSVGEGLTVLSRALSGPCVGEVNFFTVWTCAPLGHCHGLAGDTPSIFMYTPLLLSLILPSLSTKLILLVYVWIIVIMALAISFIGAVYSIPFVVTTIGIACLLHYLWLWSQLRIYEYFQEVADLQHKQCAEADRQRDELRDIIGKIAHDIRTPLVAFSYGLDALHHSLGLVDVADDRYQSSKTALEGLQQSFQHLMTIVDRCMDFHKLSHGFSLVPKLAPTSIALALQVILQQAHSESLRVNVKRMDYSGYIMTDPCWFHDNLLCLVSNAVRFSGHNSPVFLRIIKSVIRRLSSAGRSNSNHFAVGSTQMVRNDQEVALLDFPSLGSELEIDETFHATREDCWLRFEVEDWGVGVEGCCDLAWLFAAPDGAVFQRGNVGGTGLGLYCLAERLKALKGHYGVICKSSGRSFSSLANHSDIFESVLSPRQQNMHDNERGLVVWFMLPFRPLSMERDFSKPLSRKVSSHSSSTLSLNRKTSDCDPSRESFWTRYRSLTVVSMGLKGDGESEEMLAENVERDIAPAASAPNNECQGAGSGVEEIGNMEKQSLHLRVLIIDDSLLILKMLKMMFTQKGHEVVITTNGYNALDILRKCLDCPNQSIVEDEKNPASLSQSLQCSFDAVLVDVQMPIIDGLQTIALYRKMLAEASWRCGGNEQPVVVAMSANTDHVTMQEAYVAGADHFLQKPFDLDVFYAVLSKHKKQPT